MAKLDRLTAVTVCVNYADFLSQTVSNRAYFDDWIVITCREDHPTRELCATHGIRCHVSDQLGPWGDCFDSAYLKAAVINEVLETLVPDGWVLLLDADLLLPQRFRERLVAFNLYPRALYGLYGRRECDSWEEYGWRRPVEPWTENFGYSKRILGFFQLFRLDQPVNRYPYERPKPQMHDDLCFHYCFKRTLRKLLPMVGLHVGPPRVNWGGRSSGAFGEAARVITETRVPRVLEEMPRVKVLWVVGADESMPWAALAEHAETLVAVDWYGLEAGIDLVNAATDRKLLLQRLREHLESLHIRLTLIPAEAASMEAQRDTRPPDAVFFVPELSCEMASAFRKLLCTGGTKPPMLMGQFYGFPQWRSTALSVSVFFGTPDEVHADGSWIVKVPHGVSALSLNNAVGADGIALVVFCEKPEQITILGEWLAAGLKIAPSQVTAFVRRTPHDAAAVTFGALTGVNILDLPRASGQPAEALRVEDLGLLARFADRRVVFADLETADAGLVKTLQARTGGIAVASAVWWADCSRQEQESAAKVAGEVLGRPVETREIGAFPADFAALAFDPGSRVVDLWEGLAGAAQACGAARPVCVGLTTACLLADEIVTFAEADRLLSADPISAAAQWVRPLIPVKQDSTVVVVVDPAEEGWLERIATIHLGGGAYTVALMPGGGGGNVADEVGIHFHRIIEADMGLPARSANLEENLVRWFFRYAASHFAGVPLIILPAGALPFPGASLFPYLQFDAYDLILEMEVPASRRDLGPSDGKPCRTGPVFISANLLTRITAKELPSRIGWRYSVLRNARRHEQRIMLRHAGASGWHSQKTAR